MSRWRVRPSAPAAWRQIGVVLDAEQADAVASLLETFVLDDESMADDPLYQLADGVVREIRAERQLIALAVTAAELDDVLEGLAQESEASWRERGEPERSARLDQTRLRLQAARTSTQEHLRNVREVAS